MSCQTQFEEIKDLGVVIDKLKEEIEQLKLLNSEYKDSRIHNIIIRLLNIANPPKKEDPINAVIEKRKAEFEALKK